MVCRCHTHFFSSPSSLSLSAFKPFYVVYFVVFFSMGVLQKMKKNFHWIVQTHIYSYQQQHQHKNTTSFPEFFPPFFFSSLRNFFSKEFLKRKKSSTSFFCVLRIHCANFKSLELKKFFFSFFFPFCEFRCFFYIILYSIVVESCFVVVVFFLLCFLSPLPFLNGGRANNEKKKKGGCWGFIDSTNNNGEGPPLLTKQLTAGAAFIRAQQWFFLLLLLTQKNIKEPPFLFIFLSFYPSLPFYLSLPSCIPPSFNHHSYFFFE